MHTSTHNSKITGRIRTFYLSNNCSTAGDMYFLGFLCVLTHINTHKYTHTHIYGRSAYQTTALLLEISFIWIRVTWEIRLENYSSRQFYRTTAPDMCQSFSDRILCAYTASPYVHSYLVCNYTWQQNSSSLWLYYTPNDTFTANDASFISTNLVTYSIQVAVSFNYSGPYR